MGDINAWLFLMQGLVPRAKLLLTIGGTFFWGFWPLVLITVAFFAALYLVSFQSIPSSCFIWCFKFSLNTAIRSNIMQKIMISLSLNELWSLPSRLLNSRKNNVMKDSFTITHCGVCSKFYMQHQATHTSLSTYNPMCRHPVTVWWPNYWKVMYSLFHSLLQPHVCIQIDTSQIRIS